jgi:type IV secretory pathway VirB10-like protein
MGGFFSPKPPAPPPPPPVTDPDEEDRKRRLEMIERRRRGRAGMIRTSTRGVLNETNTASNAKRCSENRNAGYDTKPARNRTLINQSPLSKPLSLMAATSPILR